MYLTYCGISPTRPGAAQAARWYREAGVTSIQTYIFWKENRLDNAEKALLRVVELNPSNPEPYLLLMMIYEQKGDAGAAQRYRDRRLPLRTTVWPWAPP